MLREEGAFLRGFSRRYPEVVGYFPKVGGGLTFYSELEALQLKPARVTPS